MVRNKSFYTSPTSQSDSHLFVQKSAFVLPDQFLWLCNFGQKSCKLSRGGRPDSPFSVLKKYVSFWKHSFCVNSCPLTRFSTDNQSSVMKRWSIEAWDGNIISLFLIPVSFSIPFRALDFTIDDSAVLAMYKQYLNIDASKKIRPHWVLPERHHSSVTL